MLNNSYSGFTLVELIVVIVILGVLATIGFVSYNGYLGGARDSNRIAQLKNINDSLNLYSTTKDLPLPDDYVTVTASGTTIGFQGYAGQNVLELINYTNGGQDPKDDVYFTYYLTQDRKNFQLLAFLEETDNLQTHNTIQQLTQNIQIPGIPQTYAADYTNRFPKVYGKKLGVLTLASNNTPIQEVGTIQTAGELDIFSATTEYTSHITDTESFTGTGNILLGMIPNGNCKRIKQLGGSSGDGVYTINPTGTAEIEVYCDMTSDGGGWTLAVRALAGSVAHNTINSVATVLSPTQGFVGKLATVDIVSIGRVPGYETRFSFDVFPDDAIFFQWNNGYSPDFNHDLPINGGANYLQTRQAEQGRYTGNWENDSVPYQVGCTGGKGPFSKYGGTVIQCRGLWDFSNSITCHSGFGLNANCGNPWTLGHVEDATHRSGTLWVR